MSLLVSEDPCVPWKLPEVDYSSREETQTLQGWQVTYKCNKMSPPVLSYYYQDNVAIFTCKTGYEFIPKRKFTCQGLFFPNNRTELVKKLQLYMIKSHFSHHVPFRARGPHYSIIHRIECPFPILLCIIKQVPGPCYFYHGALPPSRHISVTVTCP